MMKHYTCPTCKSRLGLASEEYNYIVNLSQGELANRLEDKNNPDHDEVAALRRGYMEDLVGALLAYADAGIQFPSDIQWWLSQIGTMGSTSLVPPMPGTDIPSSGTNDTTPSPDIPVPHRDVHS